jgi:hypothetical protein
VPEEARSGVNFVLQKRAFSKTRILVFFLFVKKCVILVKVTKKTTPIPTFGCGYFRGAFYNPERLMRLPGKSASERLEPPP